MKEFILKFLYPRHTLSEVFIAFVAGFIGAIFSNFWPNILSRIIVVLVMLAGVIFLGKIIFGKSRAKPDEITLKFIQGIGMTLILALMISYFGWFKTEGIDYSLTSLNKTITIIYGLFLSLRAAIFIASGVLIIIGNKLKIDALIGLGVSYFSQIPDIGLPRTYRTINVFTVLITAGIYYFTHSVPQAFIYGALALDVFSIPQNIRKEYR